MERERQAYQRLLRTELVDQAGRYVVIFGDQLLGAFDGYNEAAVAGYKACGFRPFLLKKVPMDQGRRAAA
jgi:poly-D-alanine transfer protein DltD